MGSAKTNFNAEQFLDHCRMTKPPYECPHVSCRRVYRSFPGIQNHMASFDHENLPAEAATPIEPNKNESGLPPIPLTTELTSFEYEIQGKAYQMSIYDSLEMMSLEEYEASMPPEVDEPPIQDVAKTPANKTNTKSTHLKTPKSRNADKGIDVHRFTIEEKKSQKLPEAKFSMIEEYYSKIPDAPKLPKHYLKYVEKTPEQLDEEIEYDMDEEDMAWLNFINKEREDTCLKPVSMEDFELLMDRLEKESFFQAQCSGKDGGAPIDEDAVCCICMDGECQNSNVILFCDMCNLAVHQECYGVPYIPEGQWLCRRCLQSPSRAVDCVLCPNKGGAFKQTDDGRWGHVVCAMWIPEVCFANTVFLEPIDSIGNIQPARWKLTCYICTQRGIGACIQCNKVNCYTAFHVTCAQQAGLHMKIDAVRETGLNGTSVTVRKAAYCDMHTPADSDAKPQVEEVLDAVKKAAVKAASKQKMKKTRKILAEKRLASPIVSVPTLPADRIQELAKKVDMEERAHFIHRLLAYWSLKRQSRNGVPLLRRLTSSYARRNLSPTASQRKEDRKKSPESKKRSDEMESAYCLKSLRQGLEKTRILSELVKKREERKLELINTWEQLTMMKIAPFNHLILQKIDQIQELDTLQIFAEPVDTEEVHDYLDVVEKPMDLSTMKEKVNAFEYSSVDQVKADFELMIENCLNYNSKETVFHKAAIKLRDPGSAIIRQLERDVRNIGFDLKTGLLLPERPPPLPVQTESEVMKEVDTVLGSKLNPNETWADREKTLLELFDKASTLKHHITRQTRVKLIKKEISVVRRRIALKQSGTVKSASEESDSDSDHEDSSTVDDEAEPGIPIRASKSNPVPEVTEPAELKKKTVGDIPVQKASELSEAISDDVNNENSVHAAPRKRGRPPKNVVQKPASESKSTTTKVEEEKEHAQEESTLETPSEDASLSMASSVNKGVNRRTSVLFTKKAGALTKQVLKSSSLEVIPKPDNAPTLTLDESTSITKDSFKLYRQPGEIAPESDDDTQSECSSSQDSDEESGSSADTDGEGSDTDSSNLADGVDRNEGIPLEPLDLVWAKCRGYPWYPALIINPKMPRTGYFHNRVPIPVPPDEVLAHATNYETPMYLVLFFDQKRTWQWLPRNKLEPLGVNSALDKEKLVESRKPTDRKAVKRAYEKAILHRCKVTGENTGLSEESSDENES